MDVLVLIDKLDDVVHNARPVPLTDQVRVDREEIYDLLDQMRATIPEEIKQARWIVKERQEMLAEAKREAERVVRELASAGSLARRFARVEDLETLWTPKPATPPAPPKGGVFAHIAQNIRQLKGDARFLGQLLRLLLLVAKDANTNQADDRGDKIAILI